MSYHCVINSYFKTKLIFRSPCLNTIAVYMITFEGLSTSSMLIRVYTSSTVCIKSFCSFETINFTCSGRLNPRFRCTPQCSVVRYTPQLSSHTEVRLQLILCINPGRYQPFCFVLIKTR